MDNMPYSLQTLPPEAVDILRYYAQQGADLAHTDSIIDGTGLSERGFGKGIRRLVTKNYLAMSNDQVYRLTDGGRRVIEELKTLGTDLPTTSSARAEARFVRRHLVLVTPNTLTAGQPAEVVLGFEEAADEETLNAPASLLFRLSVTNGEPHLPRAAAVTLTNRQMQHKFEISAGNYTTARLRVEVCQYQDDGDEFDFCGGMYVDLPVSTEAESSSLAAYGADIILKEE
ncbi:MAG: hypothetical protein ABI835_16560 [Chloroflexota bacterium]